MIPSSSFTRPLIMPQDSETSTEPSFNTQQHQDVSSFVNEYLALINHDSQRSRLGSDDSSHRNAVFKDIKVWGSNSDSESEFLETVTNIFLLPLTLIHKAFSHKKPVDKMILHGINGFVTEGEMLLALGRPGSGCTTLFKTLAGFTGTFHGWSGEVSYFGMNVETVKKGFRGDLVYSSEGISYPCLPQSANLELIRGTSGDLHFATLKVLSTLGFAVQTKTSTEGMKHSARLRKIHSVTEKLLQIFGLEGTKTTLVGNEFIRGISSGERKRVSLAETVSFTSHPSYPLTYSQLSTNAKISLWDNSTQGLDATNSLRFGKALSTYVKSGQNIALAALYQASDDLVNMFDKIILLHEGRQIFFGTVQEARLYLEDLGFVWDNRQSLSEFLIACTDLEDRFTREGWENKVPRTLEDWERCWRESEYYAKLQKVIEEQLGSQQVEHAKKTTRPSSAPQPPSQKRNPYILTWTAQL
jgi:ATP-binding cassette subfamily G (WHITE) protein 2 (SNQ2)